MISGLAAARVRGKHSQVTIGRANRNDAGGSAYSRVQIQQLSHVVVKVRTTRNQP